MNHREHHTLRFGGCVIPVPVSRNRILVLSFIVNFLWAPVNLVSYESFITVDDPSGPNSTLFSKYTLNDNNTLTLEWNGNPSFVRLEYTGRLSDQWYKAHFPEYITWVDREQTIVPLSDSQAFYRLAVYDEAVKRLPVKLLVPDHLRETTKVPLIIALHPWFTSAAYLDQSQLPLSSYYNDFNGDGYILALPDGLRDRGTARYFSPETSEYGEFHRDGARGWNAHPGCCKDEGDQWVDDIHYMQLLVNRIASEYPVDRRRIYIVGIENGAHMVHSCLKRFNYIFAAGVAINGTTSSWLDDFGATATNTAILQIHSRYDPRALYNGGGYGVFPGSFAGVEDTLNAWAESMEIEGNLIPTGETLDLDLDNPGIDTDTFRFPDSDRIELWALQSGSSHRPAFVKKETGDQITVGDAPRLILEWLFRFQLE